MVINKKTRADFISSIHDRLAVKDSNISKEVVKVVVNELLQEMKDSLIDGQQIELRGFGVFEIRTRKQKSNAHNPRTGQKVVVPSHKVVAFRAGNDLKNAIWGIDTL